MYDNLIYKSSIEEGLLLFAGPLLFFFARKVLKQNETMISLPI